MTDAQIKQKDPADNKDIDTESDSEQDLSPAKTGGQFAVFQKRFYINMGHEIPHYSTEHVKAYATGESTAKAHGYFAMICNAHFVPRTNVTKSYIELGNMVVPKLVAYGRAVLPNGKACFCYIYVDNLGKPLFQDDREIALGWNAEKVMEKVALPILLCLKDLQQRDVTHGNIRATNLYVTKTATDEKIMLGECLSAPASLNQPAIYEPIERAMADPIGRGEGTIKDDLYSLGVLMAMYMRNFDPLRSKSVDEIISAKVVNGSYSTLIGSTDRLSSGVSDLLRGLLSDTVKTRWSLEEVFDWIEGRRTNNNQSVKMKKAVRGIKFDGVNFFYARTFAHKLLQNPQEAIHVIDNHELTHWVERSLSDNEMMTRIDLALSSAKEGGTGVGYIDRLLPRISIALDPLAPIRYRSMSIHMDAIGNAMADAFQQKKGLSNFIELFNNGILYFWISICADLNIDVAGYAQMFDKTKGYLRQKDITGGIERCLYFLNPSIHCLSPLVSDYFVTDPKEFILSLEKVAEEKKGKYPDRIIDKHAACFLVSRDARLIEPYAFDLSSNHNFRYIMANLKILSDLQKFNNIASLPHLTNWVCGLLDPVIERYHDTDMQQKIRMEIKKKKDGGSLPEILKTVENPERIKKDQMAFKRSMGQYRALDAELNAIETKLENPQHFSEKVGREWAATISGIISVLIIIGFIMVHFNNEMPM